eukprot:TRINITY_DN19809_c0_g1_i1.p1 TRINITY_DN19809_c0_g1~~TRINITY_DN19809_c0_g1_i1.p1  ORF type:complete len:311 (+),score=91.21 TRINITY_DN19809_c0_g1_i1:136-1068(+)
MCIRDSINAEYGESRLQIMASGSALELIIGDNLLNGMPTLAGTIRQIFMDAIASGEDLLEIFRRFDANRDGSIEQREVVAVLEGLGLSAKRWGRSFNSDIAAFIDSIDSFDGVENNDVIAYDRKVDYQEFIDFVVTPTIERGPDGIQSSVDLLAGKNVIALFFGTSWAPQTMKLFDHLNTFYTNLRAQGDDSFEVVYVSHDQNSDRFAEFYNTHPWTAIPYEDRERRHYMEQKLHVTTLPRVVLLDCAGGVLSHDAKFEIMDMSETPHVAMRKWRSQNFIDSQADRKDARSSRHGGGNRLTFVSGRGQYL